MTPTVYPQPGDPAAQRLVTFAQRLSKKCAGPANPCAAEGAGLRHLRQVRSASLTRLTAQFPAIKAEWCALLRGEPVLTPLGRPDTLVYLMDATLNCLAAELGRNPGDDAPRRYPPVAGSVHAYCPCGLNPLLKYYGTGELALHAGAGSELGAELELVLRVFRALARQEIESFCAVCRHREAAACATLVQR
jgi:hypothetical protein